MKYFYLVFTTQYDGYEWTQRIVTMAKTEKEAIKKAKAQDWTHANGVEVQEFEYANEITKTQFDILKDFIYTLWVD
jgi:hypothetical protein